MKLEIKVQVPGSSPRDAEFRDVLLPEHCPGAITAASRARERELSAEIEFYPSYAVFKEHVGTCGADRVRTDDIQLAKLALSQLSYSPRKRSKVILPSIRPMSRNDSGPRWT